MWAGSQRETDSEFYFRKMNPESRKDREPKFQLQRRAEEMCRDSWLTQQSTLFSFCLLPEFSLKYFISQVWGREARPTVFQNDVGGKIAQHWNMPPVGSQDTAVQLWTNQQPTGLWADPPQAPVSGPASKPCSPSLPRHLQSQLHFTSSMLRWNLQVS